MGGRGGKSGLSGGIANSKDYKEAYKTEMSFGTEFQGSQFLSKNATKDMIGYEMYVHESVTGRSLIADSKKELAIEKRNHKEIDALGKSYGMSKESIAGMKKGSEEKIKMREKAIKKMETSRGEYEKYKGEALLGNERAKRRKGRYL